MNHLILLFNHFVFLLEYLILVVGSEDHLVILYFQLVVLELIFVHLLHHLLQQRVHYVIIIVLISLIEIHHIRNLESIVILISEHTIQFLFFLGEHVLRLYILQCLQYHVTLLSMIRWTRCSTVRLTLVLFESLFIVLYSKHRLILPILLSPSVLLVPCLLLILQVGNLESVHLIIH